LLAQTKDCEMTENDKKHVHRLDSKWESTIFAAPVQELSKRKVLSKAGAGN
jgi:hypothetical protein